MSGHSKWSTIKRKKGANDQERSKIFQKLAKEIYVAAKSGDKDPINNASLRVVVEKAKGENMPKDKIQAAIDKAHKAGAGINYEEIRYEGYGSGGVAIIVDCLTDNKNRTAGFVRSAFTKKGGNLGTTNSVSYMFEKKGTIVLDKTYDEDMIMELSLENNALDFVVTDDTYEIYTTPSDFVSMKEALEKAGINNFLMSEISFIPTTPVSVDDETRKKVEDLISILEEIDDVQNVYSNME